MHYDISLTTGHHIKHKNTYKAVRPGWIHILYRNGDITFICEEMEGTEPIYNFCWRQMGPILPVPRMINPMVGPPSTQAEVL